MLEYRSTDAAGNVEATKTTSWGSNFPAATSSRASRASSTSLRLDKGLATGLLNHLNEAGKAARQAEGRLQRTRRVLRDVIDEAGKGSRG